MPGGLRQKNGCLPCRVAAANNDDFIIRAQLRLYESSAIINSRTFKARQIFERKPAVLSAGGDDDAASGQPHAAVNLDGVWPALADPPPRCPGNHHLGPELLRLRVGAASQLLSGDAGGESQIIFDL